MGYCANRPRMPDLRSQSIQAVSSAICPEMTIDNCLVVVVGWYRWKN